MAALSSPLRQPALPCLQSVAGFGFVYFSFFTVVASSWHCLFFFLNQTRLLPKVNIMFGNLVDALTKGDLREFRDLIASSDLNEKGEDGNTILHFAIRKRMELEAVESVLSAGADPNGLNGSEETPLQTALNQRSDASLVKALLAAGADGNAVDSNQTTPLTRSIELKSDLQVVAALLEAGADPNESGLLHRVVSTRGCPQLVQLLLSHGADVNRLDSLQLSPLYYSVSGNSLNVTNVLIEAGADVNIITRGYLHTLLHVTTCHRIVQKLLSCGVDPNKSNSHGFRPIHYASWRNKAKVVRELIKGGALVDYKTARHKNSCLHLTNSSKIIEELINKGCDVDATNSRGQTPLVHTIRYVDNPISMNRCVKVLLRHGAEVNAVDGDGKTALHYAVKYGNEKTVNALLERGAEYSIESFTTMTQNETAFQTVLRHWILYNTPSSVDLGGIGLCSRYGWTNGMVLNIFGSHLMDEVGRMKSHMVGNLSLHHYVTARGAKPLPAGYVIPEGRINREYPNYSRQIMKKLRMCSERGVVLERFMKCAMYTVCSERVVYLDIDCKRVLSTYLSNENLQILVLALSGKSLNSVV